MKKIKLNHLVRNIEAGDHLENFLISAVASILIIRVILAFTNYPQIGGTTFHIAHLLFGGFLMMVSIIGLLVFLNREIKGVAAVLGGVGFGVFIDELGKFITSDNNYFFQPTIALIYVIFILIYLLYRFLDKPIKITEREYVVNALEMIKEAVIHDLDFEEKRKAMNFLKNSDPNDPIVKVLNKIIVQIDAISPKKKGLIVMLRDGIRYYYVRLIKNQRFASFIIIFFAIVSVLSIVSAAIRIMPDQSFARWGILFSSSASGVFVLLGIYFIIRGERLPAYKMFKFAALISIFLTQFFLFFEEQLSAITRLAISIVIWNVLQNLIHQEILVQNKSQ